MTGIPEDDFEKTRSDASGGARRFAAAVSGAIEGFLEGIEEHDLTQTAKDSMQTAGEVVRETGTEVRAQGRSPEMQELGRDVASATGRVRASVKDAAGTVSGAARSQAEGAKDALHATMETAKESYHDAKEGVRVRAAAVKESGRRAGRAPGKIAHELGQAFAAWKNALVTTIAMMAGIFVLGIVTLVVLTIAMVAGLNQVLGDPKGTWLTFAIYAAAMLVMWAVMRTRRASARAESRRRVENAKQEVRHVGTPIRRAFGGRGGTGL